MSDSEDEIPVLVEAGGDAMDTKAEATAVPPADTALATPEVDDASSGSAVDGDVGKKIPVTIVTGFLG
jgi:hypothetical protein